MTEELKEVKTDFRKTATNDEINMNISQNTANVEHLQDK
jgi:hypothetical protein